MTQSFMATDTGGYAPLIAQLLTGSEATLVCALNGDLGAGKTTFVQQLAATLGVRESVTSPTFTIMQWYETTHHQYHTLIHMDAYRIESLTELAPLGFPALFTTPHSIICIEWAEKIAPVLPPHTVTLSFATNPDESRAVTVMGLS